jgi:hypothetical protein
MTRRAYVFTDDDLPDDPPAAPTKIDGIEPALKKGFGLNLSPAQEAFLARLLPVRRVTPPREAEPVLPSWETLTRATSSAFQATVPPAKGSLTRAILENNDALQLVAPVTVPNGPETDRKLAAIERALQDTEQARQQLIQDRNRAYRERLRRTMKPRR